MANDRPKLGRRVHPSTVPEMPCLWFYLVQNGEVLQMRV